jgi:hypothetical protein
MPETPKWEASRALISSAGTKGSARSERQKRIHVDAGAPVARPDATAAPRRIVGSARYEIAAPRIPTVAIKYDDKKPRFNIDHPEAA